jgi:hypothetical protein
MRNRDQNGRQRRVATGTALALLVVLVALPASGATRKAKRTTKPKASKSAGATAATPTKSTAKTNLETPPGAGVTSPPVVVAPFVNPESVDAFRSRLVSVYRFPAWFPFPETVTRNAKDFRLNTVGSLSVYQTLQPAGKAQTFKTSLSVSYYLPQFSTEQANVWMKSQPGYPAFRLLPKPAELETDQFFMQSEFADLSGFAGPAYQKPGVNVNVFVSLRATDLVVPSGLIPVADWPAGIAWQQLSVAMVQKYGGSLDGGAFDHRGSYSVTGPDLAFSESEQLKATLSNPANYTGAIKLAGPPTTGGASAYAAETDSVWTIPITWYGRPGTCDVRDRPVDEYRPKSSPACRIRFDIQ